MGLLERFGKERVFNTPLSEQVRRAQPYRIHTHVVRCVVLGRYAAITRGVTVAVQHPWGVNTPNTPGKAHRPLTASLPWRGLQRGARKMRHKKPNCTGGEWAPRRGVRVGRGGNCSGAQSFQT